MMPGKVPFYWVPDQWCDRNADVEAMCLLLIVGRHLPCPLANQASVSLFLLMKSLVYPSYKSCSPHPRVGLRQGISQDNQGYWDLPMLQ